MSSLPLSPKASASQLVWLALALSMGAALSLGVTRFAYGLLLPSMRADLGWSYTLAGAMNTVNALGYLLGALATPGLLRRFGPTRLLLAGALLASLFMGLSGFFSAAAPLMVQRLLAGVASAFVFITGGLLAARLAAQAPARAGFLLGLYYGGTGFGIVLSALLVPVVLEAAQAVSHPWAWAWWALSLACVVATGLLVWPALALDDRAGVGAAFAPANRLRFDWRDFSFALAGYALFGVGYIGYMTFVIALLREQGAGVAEVTQFYSLLGAAVILSSRVWARLLDRFHGGQALSILSALLGLATLLPEQGSVATGARVGRVVRRGLPVHRRLDDGAGTPQPAAVRLGGGNQRLYGGLRGRSDHRPGGGGLDSRWPRRAGAWAGHLGAGTVARRAARLAPATAGGQRHRAYLIKPSARIAAITAGRAPTRSR